VALPEQMCVPVDGLPQPPQLLLSVCVLTQLPLQQVVPEAQVWPPQLHAQAIVSKTSPLGQVVLTHAPLQHVWPLGQVVLTHVPLERV
jgi:hypothetical protein